MKMPKRTKPLYGIRPDDRDYHYLYALVDPKYPNVPRYIGETTINPRHRTARHVAECYGHMKNENNLKQRWVRGINSLGREVGFIELFRERRSDSDIMNLESMMVHKYWDLISNGTLASKKKIALLESKKWLKKTFDEICEKNFPGVKGNDSNLYIRRTYPGIING